MHSLNIVHEDLRAVCFTVVIESVLLNHLLQTNILIDAKGSPRLADFGLAKILNSQMSATSFKGQGSMRWQAPELIVPGDFEGIQSGTTRESDVYAFACVCLEVYQNCLFTYICPLRRSLDLHGRCSIFRAQRR